MSRIDRIFGYSVMIVFVGGFVGGGLDRLRVGVINIGTITLL